MSKMPAMPTIETKNDSVLPVNGSDSVHISSSAGENSSESSPVEGEKNLETPSHEEEVKPVIEDGKNTIDNTVEVSLKSIKGIEVTATRAGFYGQQRRELGDSFIVGSFEKLGEWMECKDSAIEKERIKFFENKKKAKKEE